MKKILGMKAIMNIALWVALIGSLAYTLGFGMCLYIAHSEVEIEVDKKIVHDIAYAQTYVDDQLQRVEDVAYTLASTKFGHIERNEGDTVFVGINPETFVRPSMQEVYEILDQFLDANPFVCGLAIGFEPDVYPEAKAKYGFAPYVTTVSGEKEWLQLGELHDFRKKEWYSATVKENQSRWSHPFRETNKGKVVTCFSIPLHGYGDRVIGVLALDIDTDAFRKKCLDMSPYPGSEITLLDKDFCFISHPDSTLHLKKITEVENYRAYKFDDSVKIKMKNHQNGHYDVIDENNCEVMLYFSTLPRTGWTLTIECPKSEIYRGINRMTVVTTWIAIFSIFVMIVTFVWLFRNLQLVMMSKTSMESELKVASSIQMGMIPKLYPAFPDRKELDVCGFLKPAKTVGGDLYDYFISNDRLFFCIGDVSGKGVPASLFMTVIRALFRNVSLHRDNPAEIADALNKGLSDGNDMNLFCTMFVGVLDLKTGHLDYCNAGHNPPVIRRIAGGRADLSYMETKTNIAVGVFENFTYAKEETTLMPGDAVFLYTDGVTEAENPSRQLFGDSALLVALRDARAMHANTAKELVESIYHSVERYSQGAEQSDDITMLMVEYKGLENQQPQL